MEQWPHDEFTANQMLEIRSILEEKIAQIQTVLESEAGDTVELDQARFGRLARMDAMQDQQVAKAQLASARVKLIQLGNVLAMFDADSKEFGYCFDCEELIPFNRLCLRPESRICVPCLEKR